MRLTVASRTRTHDLAVACGVRYPLGYRVSVVIVQDLCRQVGLMLEKAFAWRLGELP